MKRIFSTLMTVVLTLTLVVFAAPAPVSAVDIDLEVNGENPWTDGAFTFENISPGGDPMVFDFRLHNVGVQPGILTFSMSVSENDMAGAPLPDMSADEFASLIYVEAVSYQYIWLDHPDKETHPDGYIGSVRDDIDSWLLMDVYFGNSDGYVSLYEICQAGTIPYGDYEGDQLEAGAEITYFIEFQLGSSLDPFVAGGAILTGVEDNAPLGDGISVTITATLGTDTEQSSGNVFQAGPAPVTIGETGFYSIQAAVDAATTGDTIIVHKGTYNENIVINKGIILQAGSHPIIDGDTTGDGVPDGNCITISANGVTIDGFDIRNGYNGIIGETDNSVISNNKIHGHLNYVGSNGVGILLWGDNDNNQILNNKIEKNDRQGIFIGYDDFDGNPSTTPKISSGNIISGNDIKKNGLYTQPNGPDASAYGIQLWNADGNTIENNKIRDHDDWFPYGGTTFDFAQGIYLCAAFNNIVEGNDLHKNNYGVVAWSMGRTPVVGSNQIHYNNIHGNTGYGVRNFDSVTLDAEFNYWGDKSGPSGAGSGTGDAVSGNVDYDPWLGKKSGKKNTFVTETNIQDAVDEASSGDTVKVLAGTYNENVDIDTPLKLKGEDGAIIDGTSLGGVGVNIDCGNVEVDNFEVRNFGDGIHVYVGSDYTTDWTDIHITNNEVHDCDATGTVWGFGIYIGTEGERYNPGHGMYDPSLTDLLDFTGLKVTGNTIYNTAQAALVLQSIKASKKALDVKKNEIYGTPFSSIWIDGPHSTERSAINNSSILSL